MKKIQLYILWLLFFIPLRSFAWAAPAHQMVAQIAYDNLQPAVKRQVNRIVHALDEVEQRSNSFVLSSVWADWVKGNDMHAFDDWHFIDIPYSSDGTIYPKQNIQNVVWAIQQAQNVLESRHAKDYQKTMFLRFFLHFVGDVHQPLHCITHVSKRLPQGDKGGNLFVMNSDNNLGQCRAQKAIFFGKSFTPLIPENKNTFCSNNLHSFWDKALGLFDDYYAIPNKQRKNYIKQWAKKLEQQYPAAYFGKSVDDLDPQHWSIESFMLAKTLVYSLPENTAPNKDYVEQGQKVASQRIALAGYRLANALNIFFNSKPHTANRRKMSARSLLD